jgi:hypothetical protein
MTTANTNQPKGDEVRLTTAQTATLANIPAKSPIVIGGVSYTKAQIVALFTTLLAPYAAARAARQAATAAVQARVSNQKKVQTFLAEFRSAIVALFGRSSPILAQFGFNPVKAKSPNTGKNLVKTVRLKATRAKLGTKGSEQKAQVLAQPLPDFSVSATGGISLATPSDASSTAPASAANTTSGSTSSNGANGASTPASTATNGTTTPSGS